MVRPQPKLREFKMKPIMSIVITTTCPGERQILIKVLVFSGNRKHNRYNGRLRLTSLPSPNPPTSTNTFISHVSLKYTHVYFAWCILLTHERAGQPRECFDHLRITYLVHSDSALLGSVTCTHKTCGISSRDILYRSTKSHR